MAVANDLNLVLLYCVTGQPALQARLIASIADQIKVDKAANTTCPFRRVLVTDLSRDTIPAALASFFDDIEPDVDAFVVDKYNKKCYFSLAKLRNAGLQYAMRHAFDWILLCDSDTVIIDYSVGVPNSEFCLPQVYWQEQADEDILESAERVFRLDAGALSKGNSWFLIGGGIFRQNAFNENIYGYGFEDTEYYERALALKARVQWVPLRIIHKFHPDEAKAIDQYSWTRNQTLYEYTKAQLALGHKIDVSQAVEVVFARHRHWHGVLLLFPESSRLLAWQQRQPASYEMVAGSLRVKWDNFGRDTFELTDGVFVSETLRAGAAPVARPDRVAQIGGVTDRLMQHKEGPEMPATADRTDVRGERSATAEQVVDLLFRAVLRRPPDKDGLATYSGLLDAGRTELELIRLLMKSAEFTTKTLVSEASARSAPEPAPRVPHLAGRDEPRRFVGGLWYEIGELQFKFLIDQGLQPHHVFLDIACGSLRLGNWIIPYLNAEKYMGIDIDQKLIEHGKTIELGKALCQMKRPEFVISGAFEFHKFSKQPDFCVAQSLFTHLTTRDIVRCLVNLREHSKENTVLYATFFECNARENNPMRSHPHLGFRYTRNEMQVMGQQTGWKMEYIGDWNHPRNQKMLRYLPV